MRIKLISTIVASAALIGGAAFAGEGKDAAQKFSELDTNADGVLSQEEFVSHETAKGVTEAEAESTFDAAAGPDDELTQQEFEVAMADMHPDGSDTPY
jgi:hypothetical protein